MKQPIIPLFMILLVCLPFIGEASEPKKMGDWELRVEKSHESSAATFSSDDGAMLQYQCLYDGAATHCLYSLTANRPCREGEKVLTLVNSDAGASFQKLGCAWSRPEESVSGYVFDIGSFENTIRRAKLLSIVFPKGEAAFEVYFFNTKAANEAVEFVNNTSKRR